MAMSAPILHIGQAFDGLDDDFDVFALFVHAGEERQIAQFGQHPAQFRLKNNQDGEGKDSIGRAEQPAQHLQIQDFRGAEQRQQHDDKADDHRPAARAAQEARDIIDHDREDQNLQRGTPAILNVTPKCVHI